MLDLGETIAQIGIAKNRSSALTSSGRLFTWGNNRYAILGDGTDQTSQLTVDISSKFPLNVGETIIQTDTRILRTGALTSDGRLFAWVYNHNGALVDGTTQTQYSPVMALFDSFAIDKVVSPIANEAIDYVPIIEGIPLMVSIKITN